MIEILGGMCMFKQFKLVRDLLQRIEDKAEKQENTLSELSSQISSIANNIDMLNGIDELAKEVTKLSRENARLSEENAIYRRYYDVESEPTEEIKRQVFTEFELKRVEKESEALKTQLQFAQQAAIASACTALIAYNPYRPWWA